MSQEMIRLSLHVPPRGEEEKELNDLLKCLSSLKEIGTDLDIPDVVIDVAARMINEDEYKCIFDDFMRQGKYSPKQLKLLLYLFVHQLHSAMPEHWLNPAVQCVYHKRREVYEYVVAQVKP